MFGVNVFVPTPLAPSRCRSSASPSASRTPTWSARCAAPEHVATALGAGAQAALVGTVLLRTDESGASAIHKAALADPARTQTAITRAFTGRPARGLRNQFIDDYDGHAPSGYPAVHHLTVGLRRAAAAADDAEAVHLWAGTGYRHAAAEPAAATFARLASRL